MKSHPNPKLSPLGLTSLVLSLAGAFACDDYNCADTATCESTPNANLGDAAIGDESTTNATTTGVRTNGDMGSSSEHDSEPAASSVIEVDAASNSGETREDETKPSRTEDSGGFAESSEGTAVETRDPDESDATSGSTSTADTTTAPVELSLGETCGEHSQCQSGHCVDGVCCETACDEVCAACNQPDNVGECVATASDDTCSQLACPASTECRSYAPADLEDNCSDLGECRAEAECPYENANSGVACADGTGACDGDGECVVPDKLSLGETCTTDDQCGSGSCAATTNGGNVCCSADCEGTCQACGSDGQCNKTPLHDEACEFSCPSDTSCTSYPDAPANNCIGFGVCLSQAQFCSPSHFVSGTDCGVSAECNGSGACLTVDRQSPTVVSVTPDDDATEVERDVVIQVTFSEAIDASTIDGAVTLSGPDGDVPTTVTMLNSTTLAVSPNVTLPLIAEYQLELSSAIQDTSGNALASTPYRSVFTTRDGVWDANPKLLETNNALTAGWSMSKADGEGNALITWVMTASDQAELWNARFNATTGSWTNGSKVASDAYLYSFAMLSTGDALALVAAQDAFPAASSLLYEGSNGTWGAKQTVATSTSGGSAVWSGAGDHVVSVWVQQSTSTPTQYAIMSSTYSNGAWGAAKTVLATQSGYVSYARVAVDHVGNAVCVWELGSNVYRSNLSNGGANWTSASSVDSGQVGTSAEVTSDANGAFYITWRRLDSLGVLTGTPMVRRLSGFNGVWSAATPLRSGTGFATYEQTAIGDGTGAAMAYWYGTASDNSTQYLVRTSEFSAATWSTPTTHVVAGNGGDARFPELAFDKRGNGMLTWSQPVMASEYHHYARRYVKGRGWDDIKEFHAPTNPGSFNQYSSVAIGPDGEATVVWTQNDGSRENVWALRFD